MHINVGLTALFIADRYRCEFSPAHPDTLDQSRNVEILCKTVLIYTLRVGVLYVDVLQYILAYFSTYSVVLHGVQYLWQCKVVNLSILVERTL